MSSKQVSGSALDALQTSGASLTSPGFAISLVQGDPVSAAITAASVLESFAALAGRSPALLPISIAAAALSNDLYKIGKDGVDDGGLYGTLSDFTALVVAGALLGEVSAGIVAAGIIASIAAGIAAMLQPENETEDWQAIQDTVSDLWDGTAEIIDASANSINDYFETLGETVKDGV